MTFLELVRRLRQEARIPGDGPVTVVDQSDEMADLVNWIQQAYIELQIANGGRWRWLKRRFTLETVAGTHTYAYGDCTDVDASAPISRFGVWALNQPGTQPRRYLTSDGAAREVRINTANINNLRHTYDLQTVQSGAPFFIAVDDQDQLRLAPTPDDAYTISGYYYRGPQILAVDADVPEMPSQYHMLIVYRAMIDYGYNDVAQEIIQRAELRGNALWNSLTVSQLIQGNLMMGAPLA